MAKRLLMLLPVLKESPETGGEIYNLHLARGLARDWNVTVATFEDLPGFAREARAYDSALARFLEAAPSFDVILQDTYVYPFAALANRRLAASAALIGFGQAVYGERFERPWRRWAENRKMSTAMRTYRGLIVVSETMRSHAARLGFPKERIAVVTPGYGVPESPTPPPLGEPYRFVTAGSYQPAKGQLIAVQGMAELFRMRPELVGRVRLDLFGNQGYAPEYVEDIRRVVSGSLADSVGVHGPIDQNELWNRFATSHGFVFMASGEGIGMVTTEAMSFGCVPVLTDDQLSRELVGPEMAGVLCARTPGEVAKGMLKLIDDPTNWQRLRVAAQAHSKTLLRGWDVVVQDFSRELSLLSK